LCGRRGRFGRGRISRSVRKLARLPCSRKSNRNNTTCTTFAICFTFINMYRTSELAKPTMQC
jgi:hypothetical protein